jgi:hypothetical protein
MSNSALNNPTQRLALCQAPQPTELKLPSFGGTGFPPKIELIEFLSIGYPDNLRRRVLIACGESGYTTAEMCSLHCMAGEAFAFALLAKGNLQGEATNVPAATGASREAVLGTIKSGKKFPSLLKVVHQNEPSGHLIK